VVLLSGHSGWVRVVLVSAVIVKWCCDLTDGRCGRTVSWCWSRLLWACG
jgi:hypothetical protein